MNRARLLALLLLALAGGCAAHEGARMPRTDLSVLTAEELQAGQYASLYEAIAALRSNWVRERPPSSFHGMTPEPLSVFVGDVRAGGVDFLHQIAIGDVASVRFLTTTEAASRLGHSAQAGPAILVAMKRGP
jgi:hypothetical protein